MSEESDAHREWSKVSEVHKLEVCLRLVKDPWTRGRLQVYQSLGDPMTLLQIRDRAWEEGDRVMLSFSLLDAVSVARITRLPYSQIDPPSVREQVARELRRIMGTGYEELGDNYTLNELGELADRLGCDVSITLKERE